MVVVHGLSSSEACGFFLDQGLNTCLLHWQAEQEKWKIIPEERVSLVAQGGLVEEGMATHSSILAWRIPWTEEPSGLRSIESQRVRHK